MKFGTSITPKRTTTARRRRSGFTLAEVLAALLFMAIVIPVAVDGLRVASLAGTVAERKSRAVFVAERLLSESLITTNLNSASQSGTMTEQDREYRYTMKSESWPEDGTQYAPRQLTVEVTFAVQNRDYSVRLTTLTPGLTPQ